MPKFKQEFDVINSTIFTEIIIMIVAIFALCIGCFCFYWIKSDKNLVLDGGEIYYSDNEIPTYHFDKGKKSEN